MLEPGDIVSFSAEVKSTTGADRGSLAVEQLGVQQALESVDDAGNMLTVTGHGYANGDVVQFSVPYSIPATRDDDPQPLGTLPGGLDDVTDYYVISATADTFQVSTAPGGAAVDLLDTGNGEMQVCRMLSRHFGTDIATDTFGAGLSLIEGVAVDPLFDNFGYIGRNLDDSEEVEIRRVMCVRGSSAVHYTDPVFIYNVHDATLIYLSSGQTVDAGVAQAKSVASDVAQGLAEEITNRENADTALQTSITEQQEIIDGVSAQYTLKLDVNGHITGIGLASQPVDGVPASAFVVLADSLLVAMPASEWAAAVAYSVGQYTKPTQSNGFIYRCMIAGDTGAEEPAWPTVVGNQVVDGGITWECRALQSNAFMTTGVVDGQETVVMDSAHIGDASITSAKVENLEAGKIKGGTIQGEVINIGGNNVVIDGTNSRIAILDNQAVPATRVRLGKLGAGLQDYGLELFDAAGNKVIGFDGAMYLDGSSMQSLQPAMPGADQTAVNGTSDLLADDAGLGTSAQWGGIPDVPTTAEGWLTDVQLALGPSAGNEYVLHDDGDGNAYWGPKYGPELNLAHNKILDADTLISTTLTRYGRSIIIPNPGKEVAIQAFGVGAAFDSIEAGNALVIEMYLSVDGGATFDRIGTRSTTGLPVINQTYTCTAFGVWSGTPTGDIHLELRARKTGAGLAHLSQLDTSLGMLLMPRSDFTTDEAPLTVSIPPTASGECSKNYPTTSCTSNVSIKATTTGSGVTYDWNAVGDAVILSGGSTSECTFTATETTSDAGTDTSTSVTVDVDDASGSGPITSNTCTLTTTHYRTYANLTVSAVDGSAGCFSSSGGCTAETELDQPALSGGDGVISYDWTALGPNGVIVSGGSTATPVVSNLENVPANEFGDFEVEVTDGHGQTDTDIAEVEFTHRQV